MGTDLGKLMKMEKLTEDRVQFLVYQILKGLKVRLKTGNTAESEEGGFVWADAVRVSSQYIHSAGIVHRVRELWPARLEGFGGGSEAFFFFHT